MYCMYHNYSLIVIPSVLLFRCKNVRVGDDMAKAAKDSARSIEVDRASGSS